MPPAIIAGVGVAATVLSTGISVMGAMNQAAATRNQMAYSAQVAQNNQILADRAAADAKARGALQESQKATADAQLLGRQRAALGSTGIDVNSGTALDLQSDVAGAGELDQLTIRSNSEREAAGYEAQGMNYQNQAALDEQASANAMTAGATSAFSTALKGAGTVAGQWYDFNYGTRVVNPAAA